MDDQNKSVHSAAVSRVKETLRGRASLEAAAGLYKILGDFTRLRIVCALFETELCVNCIADVIGISQSAVSHQIRILKAHRIVKTRREGKNIFCSLHDQHIRLIIEQALTHVEHF